MNGIVICKKIRQQSAAPIVLFTGSGSGASFLEALEHGADDFIQKSASVDILNAKIKSILRRTSSNDKSAPKTFTNNERPIEYACFANWQFYPSKLKLLSPDGICLFLTQNESRLLMLFCHKNQKILLRADIAEWLNGNRSQFLIN